MNRSKTQIRSLAFFLLFISCMLQQQAVSQMTTQKPNVLFIAVDDLNDWAGPFKGYPGVITPNLDRLANEAVIFTRAYCPAPACNPSRASLMTGVRPATSGVYHNDQPWRPVLPKAVTLPQYYTAHGYDVEGIGKIFHDKYNDRASWPVYHKVEPSPHPVAAPVHGFGHFDWSAIPDKDEDMGDYKNVEKAIAFLSDSRKKPFFLAVGFTRPHLPWYVPKKYFDLYPLENITLPKTLTDDLGDVPGAGVKIARPGGDHKFITEHDQWKNAIQGYLASITFSDAQIGRLLDALRKSRYYKNTIIVLFGDHGWHLGEKSHWRKFALWEEATRVPLMVVAPGVTKGGSVSERTVNLMDMYPTLLELTSLPKKAGIEANSIVPLLKNPKAPWRYPSVTTHGLGNHAVRSERWRYIRYEDGSEELYDHDIDPHEWKNLAGDAKFTSVKAELARSLPKLNAPNAPAEKSKTVAD